ncbi:MAG: hypothetical protein K1X79_11575 [Oligoflexia bacterium]|nr:hypothetical protein [Oligoflexia bacterium]
MALMCPTPTNGTSSNSRDPGDGERIEWRDVCAQLQAHPELALISAFSEVLNARVGEFGQNITLEEEAWQRSPELRALSAFVDAVIRRLDIQECPFGAIEVAVSFVKETTEGFYWGLSFRSSQGDWLLPSSVASAARRPSESDIDVSIEKCGTPTLVVFKCQREAEPEFGFVIVDDGSAVQLAENANAQSERLLTRERHQPGEFTAESINASHTSYVANVVRQALMDPLRGLRSKFENGEPLIQALNIVHLEGPFMEVTADVKSSLGRLGAPDHVGDRFHLLLHVNPATREMCAVSTRLPDPILAEIGLGGAEGD